MFFKRDWAVGCGPLVDANGLGFGASVVFKLGLGAVDVLLPKRDDAVVVAGTAFEELVVVGFVNSDDAEGAPVDAAGVENKDVVGAVLVEGAAVVDGVVDEVLLSANKPGPPLAFC